MNRPGTLTAVAERGAVFLVAAIPTCALLAFGGAAWWGGPALGLAIVLLCSLMWIRRLARGDGSQLASPLGAIAAGMIAWGLVQLVPLPRQASERFSPESRGAWSWGVIPARVAADAPEASLAAGPDSRTPATLDRGATLAWCLGAGGCLLMFLAAGQLIDRWSRLAWVVGGIVAAAALNVGLGWVQWLSGRSGYYASVSPAGQAPWLPNALDRLEAPGASLARPIDVPAGMPSDGWALVEPLPRFEFGTLVGGASAALALMSLALPLAWGLAIHLGAPDGRRGRLVKRLRERNAISPMLLLIGTTALGLGLAGAVGGIGASWPIALGVGIAGLLGALANGLGRAGVVATLAMILIWIGGTATHSIDRLWPAGLRPVDVGGNAAAWALRADFPIAGSGWGTFPSLAPFYQPGEATPTAAGAIPQAIAEGGLIGGVALPLTALLWVAWRLPRALGRVGTADRALAWTLIAASISFGSMSGLQWTIQLPALALAAAAMAGILDRWLAGATDLFVARG